MSAAPRRFEFPWGLVLALVTYAALVLLYVNLQYWRSPGYLAAKNYVAAEALIGKEDGRTAKRKELEGAYSHLLEAARLVPEELWLHRRLETLNARFEERGWQVPQELRHRADAVAVVWRNIQAQRKPILAVGLRDRGWDAQGLLAGPTKALWWSLVGVLGILLVWAQARFNWRRVKAQEHEQELQKLEQEIEELGAFRKGLDRKR